MVGTWTFIDVKGPSQNAPFRRCPIALVISHAVLVLLHRNQHAYSKNKSTPRPLP